MKIQFSILFLAGLNFLFACSEPNNVSSTSEEMEDTAMVSTDIFHEPGDDMSPFMKYDSTLLDQNIDSIWFSDKVQNHFGTVTENSHPYLKIVGSETAVENELMIKLVEDSGGIDINHFLFYLYPEEEWEIFFFDTLNNRKIPFDEWKQM